jgi:hypothetical protein
MKKFTTLRELVGSLPCSQKPALSHKFMNALITHSVKECWVVLPSLWRNILLEKLEVAQLSSLFYHFKEPEFFLLYSLESFISEPEGNGSGYLALLTCTVRKDSCVRLYTEVQVWIWKWRHSRLWTEPYNSVVICEKKVSCLTNGV